MKTKFILAALAAALLTGCFKEVSYKTTYVLKPLSQQSQGDLSLPLQGAQAFAYLVDTTQWTVASYDDALQGVLSRKENPSDRMTTPAAIATTYTEAGDGEWLQMPLSKESQMVVLVDTEARIYAYTQQILAENLSHTYVSVLFKRWKEGNSYQDGKWSFYNEFYVPPVFVACVVNPLVQYEEGGELADVPQAKVYAYAADTTEWYIASYDDASRGVITSKRDPSIQRDTPNFPAYKQTDTNDYKMEVSEPVLMLVAVDQSDRLYAYTKKEVDLQGEPQTFPIAFRPWIEAWITDEDGWQVVNQSLAPQTEPQTPAPKR